MKPMPANRSFYCRAKYNNQEKYYRAIEGRSHDNFHMCIYTRIVFFGDNFILHCHIILFTGMNIIVVRSL